MKQYTEDRQAKGMKLAFRTTLCNKENNLTKVMKARGPWLLYVTFSPEHLLQLKEGGI